MNKKLSDLNIDRKDIIETYKDGAELYESYEIIKDLLGQGKSPAEIAKELSSNHSDYKCYLDRAYSITKGKRPKCLKGVEYLEDKNIIPLNINSSTLPLINLLASATFWHGSLSGRANMISPVSGIVNISNQNQETAIKQVLDELDIQYSGKSQKPKQKVEFTSRSVRILKLLGMPIGRKKTNETLIPEYIETALNSLRDINSSEEERTVSYHILHDFALSLLFFRSACKDCNSSSVVKLHTFDKKEKAQKQTKLTKEIFGCAFPSSSIKGKGDCLAINNKVGKNGVAGRIRLQNTLTDDEINAHYFQRIKDAIAKTRQSTAGTLE